MKPSVTDITFANTIYVQSTYYTVHFKQPVCIIHIIHIKTLLKPEQHRKQHLKKN